MSLVHRRWTQILACEYLCAGSLGNSVGGGRDTLNHQQPCLRKLQTALPSPAPLLLGNDGGRASVQMWRPPTCRFQPCLPRECSHHRPCLPGPRPSCQQACLLLPLWRGTCRKTAAFSGSGQSGRRHATGQWDESRHTTASGARQNTATNKNTNRT